MLTRRVVYIICFFFFQAEDGIRDIGVTGVQTCALPISVAMGPNLPRMLHGGAPAIALPDLKQFKVMAQAPGTGQMVGGGFEAMYSQTVDHALHGTGTETFEAIDLLRKADPTKY